jgi:hypothetical protein
MNSLQVNASVGFGLEVFEFLFGDRHLLILGVLEAADEIFTLNNNVTDRTMVLIAYARAALVV